MKSKKAPTKRKISLFKLNNKRLNKLSKQGKLKKAVGKKKLVGLLKERTSAQKLNRRIAPEEEEEAPEPDIPLQEADYDYYATPGRDYSFLTQLSEQKKGKRKRKGNRGDDKEDDEGDDYEGRYERKGVGRGEGVVRHLLPTKSKKGLVHRCVEMEDGDDVEENDDDIDGEGIVEEEEEEDEDNDAEEEEEEGENEMERFINEEQKKEEMKKFIKEACMYVMQDVEENIGKVHQVLDHISAKRPVFIIKYAMVSIMEVFKDIIPDYKIRQLSEDEKAQKMKKETVKLLSTEDSLLKSYKRYIDILHDFIKGKNLLSKDKENPSDKLMKKKRILRKQAIACLGDLLITKSHFNYRTEIVAILVHSLFHHHSKTSDVACEMVSRLFTSDKQGEVTLEVVRLIGRGIKEKKFDVKSKVLDTFLCLRIKHAERGDDDDDGVEGGVDGKKKAAMERQKKKLMSRKEKKRQKNMKHLEMELKEVALGDATLYKKKYQTETVSVVFLVYFRILKQAHSSSLLSSVLQGLAKFCHLINVSFFDDLFNILTTFVQERDLTTSQSLCCIQTALTLLMGQGSAFNIDPQNFYVHLYNMLLSFNHGNQTKDLTTALTCLNIMLIQRRRQVTEMRCLPYVKRMCTLSCSLPPSSSLPLLCLIRNIFNLYPKCDILLDTESLGSGSYQSEMADPEHCNAQNTSLYELHLMRSSYHSDMRLYSEHLLNNLPRTGRYQLPISLSRLPEGELYKEDFSHVLSYLDKIKPHKREDTDASKEDKTQPRKTNNHFKAKTHNKMSATNKQNSSFKDKKKNYHSK